MYLCLCWCCVPLMAHSTPTSTVACSRRPGCYPCVLPWPCVREAAANASRGGLASGRALGEWRTHHCVVIKGIFLNAELEGMVWQRLIPRLADGCAKDASSPKGQPQVCRFSACTSNCAAPPRYGVTVHVLYTCVRVRGSHCSVTQS